MASKSSTKSKSRGKSKSQTTTDHDEILQWAEAHGGKPAAVQSTESEDEVGMIRIMFEDAPNAKDEGLEEIEWDEWFEAFESNELALVYDPKSNFNKLVSRETDEESGADEETPE